MYGLAPFSDRALASGTKQNPEELLPLGPAYFGAVAFGDIGENVGTQRAAIVASVAVTLSPVVMIGADTVPRTATITVESGLSVSLTSTIPTYAVGLIAPVVSVAIQGNTTVSGTAALTVTPRVTIYSSHSGPILVNIVVRPRVSITSSITPAGVLAANPVVTVSATGLVVTHGRANIIVPAYVSAQAVTGFVGTCSATINAVFSATASHVKAATINAIVPVSVSASAQHGATLSGGITVPVSFSAVAGAFNDIQLSGAISVPVYAYLRGAFNDNSVYADYAYVLTKQPSVSVLQ